LARVRASLGEFDYILEGDREIAPEEQTVFRLKPLSWRDREAISEQQVFTTRSGMGYVPANQEAKIRKILSAGLMGWRNLRDENGSDVAFSMEVKGGERRIPDELLERIAPFRMELTEAILDASSLGADAKKNST